MLLLLCPLADARAEAEAHLQRSQRSRLFTFAFIFSLVNGNSRALVWSYLSCLPKQLLVFVLFLFSFVAVITAGKNEEGDRNFSLW